MDPFLLGVLEGLPPGRALDLACGYGRHSRWLVEHGWRVLAVDRDAERIEAVRALGIGDAHVADLEAEVPDYGQFDLVVCWLYYQPSLFEFLRRSVRAGGVAACAVKLTGRFAARPGELRERFAGWEPLLNHEDEGFARFAARKPPSG